MDDYLNFQHIFDLFENTYNHISIICSIEKSPYIDDKNRRTLEKLFNKKAPLNNREYGDELDLVYNYHLNKILENLSLIDSIL